MKNTIQQKLCFVIMGYGKKTDPTLGKTYDLDSTYINIIKPAVERAGFKCVRGDEVLESGLIDKSMYALLIHADLVIADITTFNANAIYELGIRHAARPFSTIIMREKDGTIPFDLSHNKMFTYSHMGEDIGVSEAERSINALHNLIIEVDKTKEVDSPLFHHIRGVEPYTLPKNEYIQVIQELAEKEDSLFALAEKARIEMANENFEEAAKYWKLAKNKVDNDVYYTQQLALCTYKNKNVEPNIALIDALKIINELEPDDRLTTDPETLGITGAIYKKLWLNDKKSIAYLERAIQYYKSGFTINQDYYTGENYALCLDLMSTVEKDEDEKIYLKVEAKKTRKKIIEIIEELKLDEDFEIRSDLKWIFATLSNCYFALNNKNEFETFQTKFLEQNPETWEIETFEETINLLKTIYK
ncbi:hypothetical protein OBK28_09360 [Empedobacter falsenii]